MKIKKILLSAIMLLMVFSCLNYSINAENCIHNDMAVIELKYLELIEKSSIAVFDYINNYAVIGINAEQCTVLRNKGIEFEIIDSNIENKEYYILNVSRSDGWASVLRDYDIIFSDHDDHIIVSTAQEAEKLPETGIMIAKIFLVQKPVSIPSEYCSERTVEFDPVVNDLISSVDNDAVYNYCGGLSGEWPVSIGGSDYTITSRNSNYTEGIQKATQYAYEFFSSLGLDAEYHYFSGPGQRNVIAKQEGSLYPDKYYIICAHIDSMPSGATSPGADDNASGSVAVMLAAELFSDYLFDYSIIYALWTGEEQGLIGSGYYAQDAYNSGMDIEGVINLDMIAWDSTGDPVIRIHAKESQIPSTMVLADTMADIIDIYSLNLVPEIVSNGLTYSDHASFWDYGYSAILGIEEDDGDFNPYYHTVNDRLMYLNLDYFRDFARASIASIAHLAGIISSTSDGMVLLDSDIYSCSSEVNIQVIDTDLAGQEYISVNVKHDQDTAGINTDLYPASMPGFFEGSVLLGTDYEVNHNNILTVSYFDEDTGGGSSEYKTAEALIDCTGPAVSDPVITEITGSSARFTFQTNEESISYIYYGLSCDDLNMYTLIEDSFCTDHSGQINGLEGDTSYYFSIYAMDIAGNTANTDCLSFKTMGGIHIGDGTVILDKAPLYTYYHDNRTQIIYAASEMGDQPQTLKGLSINVTSLPGRQLDNWTIRLKHTSKDNYNSNASFENTGWTVVYQNNETISATGINSFCFDTPFEYNGQDNIMLDLSFNNNAWTSQYGKCYWTASADIRTVYAYSDSYDGDPLDWSGSSMSYFYSASDILNIEFFFEAETLPNEVQLDYFSALGSGGIVDIEWHTLSEVNLLGYNLYRIVGKKVSPFVSYAPVKLNSSLIPGQGGPSQGYLYQWDDNVKPGGIYFYVLKAVFIDGQSQEWRIRLNWQ